MSEIDKKEVTENNYYPAVIAIMNFSVLLPLAMANMASTSGLWDFIFVGVGVYFSMKFIGLVKGAHEFKATRVSPHERTTFPKEGIYAKIRNPIGAAMIYMNIAYLCFVRSFVLVTVIPVFIALWYMYAAYEEKILLNRFGDEYRAYMQATSMFRGSGYDQQRLPSSGYDMY